jgi:hypothetical protein
VGLRATCSLFAVQRSSWQVNFHRWPPFCRADRASSCGLPFCAYWQQLATPFAPLILAFEDFWRGHSGRPSFFASSCRQANFAADLMDRSASVGQRLKTSPKQRGFGALSVVAPFGALELPFQGFLGLMAGIRRFLAWSFWQAKFFCVFIDLDQCPGQRVAA